MAVDGGEGSGAPKSRQKSVGAMTASTESSPLYFSGTAVAATGAADPFKQMESRNSMGSVLVPPKDKPQQHNCGQPVCTAAAAGGSRAGRGGGAGGGGGGGKGHSASEVKQEKRITGFDPYFSYKDEVSFLANDDDEPDYEPIEAPEAAIDADDGPDYDNVPDEPDYDNVPDEPDYDSVSDGERDLPTQNAQGITFDDPNYA